MKHYQPFHRRFRPKNFLEVIGQKAIVQALQEAVIRGKVSSSYLFSGQRGTGKTTLARLLAKALNCLNQTSPNRPCSCCNSCLEIDQGSSLDVIEIDGASNRSIDDVRKINETIALKSGEERYKVYIIDEVHMLTKEAFNALLKNVEEPPLSTLFIFATTEPQKIPLTIISRCQHFQLKKIDQETVVKTLQEIATREGIAIALPALQTIAQRSEGSLRDALSLLDQLSCLREDLITQADLDQLFAVIPQEHFFLLDQARRERKFSYAFALVEEALQAGWSPAQLVEQLVDHVRSLLLAKLSPHQLKKESPFYERYEEEEKHYSLDQLSTLFHRLIEELKKIPQDPFPRFSLENLLLYFLRSYDALSLDGVVQKLEKLERKIAEQPPTPPPRIVQEKKEEPVKKQEIVTAAPPLEEERSQPLSMRERSRYDTLMQFASVELRASLQR